MSKPEDILEKARNNPIDVSLEELKTLMDAWGFKVKKKKYGYNFPHPELKRQPNLTLPSVHIPHGKGKAENKVDPQGVKNCVKAIDKLLEMRNDT